VSAFIDRYRAHFGVELIRRTLGVSASAYYQRASGERSARAREDERLTAKIRKVFAENYECYGVRRIHAALLRDGEQVGRDQSYSPAAFRVNSAHEAEWRRLASAGPAARFERGR
jgi:putative transposase